MHVLHVVPAVAERYGGPSRVIVDLCWALAEQDVDVLVATTDADGASRLSVPLERVIEHEGVPMIFFRRQWSEAYKYSRPLARWLSQNVTRFDLVHIHAVFSYSSLAAAWAARRAKVPYVVRPLGSLAPWALAHRPWRKRTLWQLGIKRMLNEAAAVHCTSELEERQVQSLLGTCRTITVPLGVNIGPLEASEAPDIQSFGDAWRPYVLALGRLHPVKSLDLLIRSFLKAVCQKRFEKWRLVIAGDGEPSYVSYLHRLAKTDNGNEKVIFAGWLKGAAKEAVLRRAALVAVPSHQENFGITVFEAMGRGVPVAVSENIDVAGMIEKERAGWTFDLEESSMSAVLATAFAEEADRLERGKRGRHLVETRFTWPIVTGKLLDLYRDVCSHN